MDYLIILCVFAPYTLPQRQRDIEQHYVLVSADIDDNFTSKPGVDSSVSRLLLLRFICGKKACLNHWRTNGTLMWIR